MDVRDRADDAEQLERTITLPWLVFYGVGITVGAGIFALIGELLGTAGSQTPLAFLVAGAIAGLTAFSYMLLVRRFPRAGGEAIWVREGLGPRAGTLAGFGVITAGIVSSSVVALAFGGYLNEVVDLPATVGAVLVVVVLSLVACSGVRQSLMLAAFVTVLETGTLIVVIVFGLPDILRVDALTTVFESTDGNGFTSAILSGAVIAFFAFIGFEDIVNMAEETVDPERVAPKAIAWTLAISVSVYVLLGLIAVNAPDPAAIEASDAPMATLFEMLSGRSADTVATIAALAMTNGILSQVIMSSRVVYGMSSERPDGLITTTLGRVHPRRHTPVAATGLVAAAVIVLVVFVPLLHLAQATSVIVLTVFTLVNISVYRLAVTGDDAGLHRWRYVAVLGAALAAALAVWQGVDTFTNL